ncbi:MAG: FKBP-type peptidyl-prolyl cis-trans isomerase [Bacteroidales bacterium]|nr:FKBP-type peptidyl-prolyl cis-trans isomerase [Bacteroidales bacterium]
MDKTSYAVGMSIAQNMLQSGVRDLTIDDFVAGVKDTIEGREPQISFKEADKLLQAYFRRIDEERKDEQAAIGDVFKKEGEEFLEANAHKEGVICLGSGLQYKVLVEGKGRKPEAISQVRCHYEGRFIDGTVFDSSFKRGEPAVFGLNQVIRGWTEGLQLMSEGSKYEFYIPYDLAYGEEGAHGAIPPCATLIFTVELLEVL